MSRSSVLDMWRARRRMIQPEPWSKIEEFSMNWKHDIFHAGAGVVVGWCDACIDDIRGAAGLETGVGDTGGSGAVESPDGDEWKLW